MRWARRAKRAWARARGRGGGESAGCGESAHSGDVNSVAFSPDGKTIVSGSDDKTLKVWDAGVLTLIPLNPHAQN